MEVSSVSTGNPVQGSNQKTLGKEDFLKLLLNQLKYQDPLNPMDSIQMISQLTQFSSLEQLFNINDSMKALVDNQTSMNTLLTANAFIGKIVTVDHEGNVANGEIRCVGVEDGMAYVEIGDDKFPVTDIVEIRENQGNKNENQDNGE